MSKAKRQAKGSQHIVTDKELDDALEMTFPASDPVSLGGDQPAGAVRIDRAPASIDAALVDKLAKQVKSRANARKPVLAKRGALERDGTS